MSLLMIVKANALSVSKMHNFCETWWQIIVLKELNIFSHIILLKQRCLGSSFMKMEAKQKALSFGRMAYFKPGQWSIGPLSIVHGPLVVFQVVPGYATNNRVWLWQSPAFPGTPPFYSSPQFASLSTAIRVKISCKLWCWWWSIWFGMVSLQRGRGALFCW